MRLPNKFKLSYLKQGYRLVGEHSAIKTCHWVKKSLNTNGNETCYKQRFYGIPCHRCLQMTPSLGHCTQNCIFCWRGTPENVGAEWDQTKQINGESTPQSIVEGCIKAHKELIYGFGGNPKVNKERLKEALNPIHVAISLEGEPTIYENLGQLIEAFFEKGFKSVFIVTNGTRPKSLEKLSREPSQLYVSVSAPDEDTYNNTCKPLIPKAWEKLMETLQMLDSFSCPTVLRHTLLPKRNMKNVKDYAKLANLSNATYLEPKAAMSVGFARKRFGYKEMARHEDIIRFAESLSIESGYKIVDDEWMSSIVLLSKRNKPIKFY